MKIFSAINCIGKQYTTIQYNTISTTRPRARCVQPVTSLKIRPIVERISVSQTCHFHPIFADFFCQISPSVSRFWANKVYIQEEITFPSQTYRIRHNWKSMSVRFNILLVLLLFCLRNMYILRYQITSASVYTINADSFYYIMVWRYVYKRPYANKTLTLWKSMYCERAERASLENFGIFTY